MTPLKMLNLSFKIFARLATETSLAVLSTLLLDWLEHLKTPLIDKVAHSKSSISKLFLRCMIRPEDLHWSQTIKIIQTPKALRLSKTTAMTTSGITSRPFISTLFVECFSDYYKTTTKLLPLRMLKEFYKIMKIIIQHFFYTTATSLQKQLWRFLIIQSRIRINQTPPNLTLLSLALLNSS